MIPRDIRKFENLFWKDLEALNYWKNVLEVSWLLIEFSSLCIFGIIVNKQNGLQIPCSLFKNLKARKLPEATFVPDVKFETFAIPPLFVYSYYSNMTRSSKFA